MLQLLLNARSSLRPHGWTSARIFESYSSVAGAPRLCSFGTVCARSYTWDPPALPLFFKFKGCHHFCRSHVVMRIAAAVRNTGVVSNSHGWVPGLAEQFWFKVAPRSTKLGHRTTSMRRSWTFWRFSSWPVQCRGKISCRTMWPVCCSSWPRNPQGVTLWMRLGKPCGVGNWVIGGGVSLGGLADQCQEHLHSSWGARSCGCCSERPSLRWSSSPNHAPFAAHLASPIASFAATRSAENATSSGRFVPSVQVLVQISLAAYVMSQGRYAMEAAGHVEGWDLQNATEILAEQRAREFRRQFHLESDEDLAFAFESFEDAKQAGGTAFAIQWVEARHSAQANLLGDAAEVIESSAGSARDKPALERKPQPSRGKGVTLSRSAFEPEHVTRRVDALALVFFEAGVFRPSMRTEATTLEQKKAIERLCQEKVTAAEPVTIHNAIRTWRELQNFMNARGRDHIETLDLAAFIQGGTLGPSRALNSLKWLNKHASLRMELENLVLPTPASMRQRARNQALVVEPPMLAFLERGIEDQYNSKSPKWTALLSSWLVAVGVMRHQHLVRSEPMRLSRSTLHMFCDKGKQASKRSGFEWCVPATFSTGFGWAAALLEAKRKLPAAVRDTAGLVFNEEGAPWALSECQNACQALFSGHIADTEALTSYSWRRLGPTIGTVAKFTDLELNALGDWEDRSKFNPVAVMPIHYSGGKRATSMRIKHLAYALSVELGDFQSWEMIPPGDVDRAREKALPQVDSLVSKDGTTVWQKTSTPERTKRAFDFTQEHKKRALENKTTAQGAGGSIMPASINDKLLTKYLRNGTPLCASFQNESCRAEQCSEAHLCAVVMQSGRACGGKHSAKVCYARRFVKAEKAPQLPVADQPEEAEAEEAEEPSATGAASMEEEVDYNPPSETEEEPDDIAAGADYVPLAKPKGKRSPSAAASAEKKAPQEGASSKGKRSPKGAGPPPEPAAPPAKRTKKNPASGSKAPPEPEGPPPKKTKSSEHTKEAEDDTFQMPEPPAALSASKADQVFDRLATIKGKAAQAPTFILETSAGGKLWLSGIPTARSQSHFPRCTLQVCCFPESPGQRGGVVLQGALLRHLSIANEHLRQEDWRKVWPLILQTLVRRVSAVALHIRPSQGSRSFLYDQGNHAGRKLGTVGRMAQGQQRCGPLGPDERSAPSSLGPYHRRQHQTEWHQMAHAHWVHGHGPEPAAFARAREHPLVLPSPRSSQSSISPQEPLFHHRSPRS